MEDETLVDDPIPMIDDDALLVVDVVLLIVVDSGEAMLYGVVLLVDILFKDDTVLLDDKASEVAGLAEEGMLVDPLPVGEEVLVVVVDDALLLDAPLSDEVLLPDAMLLDEGLVGVAVFVEEPMLVGNTTPVEETLLLDGMLLAETLL